MRKLLIVLLVFLVAVALWSVFPSCWAPTEPEPPARIVGKRPPAPASPPAARAPDATAVAAARTLMADSGQAGRCGPYALYTDVGERALLAACQTLGSALDATYAERYGVTPAGAPSAALLLFAATTDYRAFVDQDASVSGAYAGYASAVRGFVALHAGDQPAGAVLATLTHEMTHLVNRRALGRDLPPWLSEGLADGIGDTASSSGFGPLVGFRGVEGQVERLRGGYRAGRAGSLQRLAGLERSAFDRATVSYDYEQSALLVRYLLAAEPLAPRFRIFLQELAGGERYAAATFRLAMGRSWSELEQGFRAWLGVE